MPRPPRHLLDAIGGPIWRPDGLCLLVLSPSDGNLTTFWNPPLPAVLTFLPCDFAALLGHGTPVPASFPFMLPAVVFVSGHWLFCDPSYPVHLPFSLHLYFATRFRRRDFARRPSASSNVEPGFARELVATAPGRPRVKYIVSPPLF